MKTALADRLAKIPTDGGVWHRMGDLGWMDEQGPDLVLRPQEPAGHRPPAGTLYTIPCEASSTPTPRSSAAPWSASGPEATKCR